MREAADALSASQAELRDCERRCDEWREQSCRDSALAVCNETLRAEIRRLRVWQSVIFDGNAVFAEVQHSTGLTPTDVSNVLDAVARIARAALAGTEDSKP
jgi:hypothetical protein